MSLIFRKSLHLDAATAGEAKAVTLMSTDIDSITSGVADVHEIWASVLEMGLAVYLLNLQIGAACFVVIIPAVGESTVSIAPLSLRNSHQTSLQLHHGTRDRRHRPRQDGLERGRGAAGLDNLVDARPDQVDQDDGPY